MMRLEAETTSARIRVAVLSHHLPVEEVPGVELYARLCGRHIERAPAGRLRHMRGVNEPATSRGSVQHERVVVTVAVLQLLVRLIDARANRRRLAEVERRSRDRRQSARRDERRVDSDVAVRVDRQHVIEHRSRSLAREVEVRVIRQVDGRRFIGRGLVLDRKLVPIRQRVGDRRVQRTRIALLTVGAGVVTKIIE